MVEVSLRVLVVSKLLMLVSTYVPVSDSVVSCVVSGRGLKLKFENP